MSSTLNSSSILRLETIDSSQNWEKTKGGSEVTVFQKGKDRFYIIESFFPLMRNQDLEGQTVEVSLSQPFDEISSFDHVLFSCVSPNP